MSELVKAIEEYANIVNTMKEEYTKEDLTIAILRKEHEELNFMDDEELNDLINNVNNSRIIKSF